MRALAAAIAGLAMLAPATDAAKKPVKRKAQVVCFKKAGKKVCRKRAPATKTALKPVAPAPVFRPAVAIPADSAPVAGAPTSAPGATPQPAPMVPAPVVKPDCGTSPWVGYTAEDVNGVFRLTGRRTCVPGPAVSFQLRNVDAQDHNLWAERPGARWAIIDDVSPGETRETTTTLSAGEWRLFCDIEGHESMSRTLTVLD